MAPRASDPNSIYFYDPSFPLCIVAAILYLVPTVLLSYLTCVRYKTWYFVCVPIGCLLETAGYIARAVSVKNVESIPPYAVSSSLIVIAPLFVAAGNYLIIGRLILSVLPLSSQKILGIRPTRITKVFVGCDIVSFLIQVSGSGIASSNNWTGDIENIGVDVLITGLATQLVTIVIFMVIVTIFSKKAVWEREAREDAPDGWKKILRAIVISCVLITIRSLYRLIEFALGIHGYPFTHEWNLYVLEALPMLPAFSIFCLWYPGRYLPKKKLVPEEDLEQMPKRGDRKERLAHIRR